MRLAIALVLLAAASANAATADGFEALTKDGDELGAKFCGRTTDLSMSVTATGTLAVRAPSSKIIKAKLPLWKDEYLEWTWVKPYRGDLLVAFEASNGLEGRGGVCRFQLEPLARRWCSRIYGFNVMASVGADDSVYVGSIDFVGRINVADGKYLWQVRGLYQKDRAFNSFGVPSVHSETVAFEATAGAGSSPDKRLTLDRQTGAIKGIETIAKRSSIGLQRARGSCAPRAADPAR